MCITCCVVQVKALSSASEYSLFEDATNAFFARSEGDDDTKTYTLEQRKVCEG